MPAFTPDQKEMAERGRELVQVRANWPSGLPLFNGTIGYLPTHNTAECYHCDLQSRMFTPETVQSFLL